MRIPFMPDLEPGDIPAAQVEFIQHTRGGSPFLFAGALFWCAAGLAAVVTPGGLVPEIYLYGGLSVPVLGFLIARLMQARMLHESAYTSLAAIAPMVTVFCLPVVFILGRYDPRLIPAVLTIIDAAHLPILMWIHLDYTYFLAACLKVIIGLLFLLSVPDAAHVGVGFLSAGVSAVAALMVWRASRDPLRPYLRRGSTPST